MSHDSKSVALEKIQARVPELVDRMFELADGVKMVGEKRGTTYNRPPERAAIEYLLNHVLGRPNSSKSEPERLALEGSVTIVLPDNGRNVDGRELAGGALGNPTTAGTADSVSLDAR